MKKQAPKHKGLLLFSAPLGGTSMVAGVLHHLGIYMGSNLTPTFEDPSLSNLTLLGLGKHFKQAIIDRNRIHADWGWKFPGPSILEVLPEISGELRNPFFLVIYRDVFAIANRNSLSAYGDYRLAVSEKKSTGHLGHLLRLEPGYPYLRAFLQGLEICQPPASRCLYFFRSLKNM